MENVFYGIKAIDSLGVPCLKYITTSKESALKGVEFLLEHYKHTTMRMILLIKYNQEELIPISRYDIMSDMKGDVIGAYYIEGSPGIMDKNFSEVQAKAKAIRESSKISLKYEGDWGYSMLLRLNFGGLVDREKLYKRVDDFIKNFNNEDKNTEKEESE